MTAFPNLGDLSKAITEITEFKRAVLRMNSLLETLTDAINRNSISNDELRSEIRKRFPLS